MKNALAWWVIADSEGLSFSRTSWGSFEWILSWTLRFPLRTMGGVEFEIEQLISVTCRKLFHSDRYLNHPIAFFQNGDPILNIFFVSRVTPLRL
jgi:hypothetical protein